MAFDTKKQEENDGLLIAVSAFLKKYFIYDMEMRLENCKKEILCYGGGYIDCYNLSIEQDYFDTIHNLTLDNDYKFNLIGVEFPQQDVIRLIKTNGDIFIKGFHEQERKEKYRTLDIGKELKYVRDIAREDLIDWTLSREIDGIPYYVLDLFRIKIKVQQCREYMNFLADLRYFLKVSDYKDITKTIYFTPYIEGNSEYMMICVWDIVNSKPINKRKFQKI